MNRSDLKELHYIAPIANAPSIMEHGILSYHRCAKLRPVSVAMAKIQDIRSGKRVPGGRPLHDYANLYLCARNPMLFKLKHRHRELCVLRVALDVLDLPDVIITDGNAASDYTAFWPSPAGLGKLNGALVFAEDWTAADQIAYWEKKRVKCAEVLVPDRVAPEFILGARVSCADSKAALLAIETRLDITIDRHLFFL